MYQFTLSKDVAGIGLHGGMGGMLADFFLLLNPMDVNELYEVLKVYLENTDGI